jgi:Ser/Thr protein kinase RdoA (MazF antagonist)
MSQTFGSQRWKGCPVCKATECTIEPKFPARVSCPRCGQFQIMEPVCEIVGERQELSRMIASIHANGGIFKLSQETADRAITAIRVAHMAKSRLGLSNEEMKPGGGFGMESMLFIVGGSPRYTLRVFPPSRPKVQIVSQLEWLRVLRDQGVLVPRVSEISRGPPLVGIPAEGGDWQCLFLDWIQGNVLAEIPSSLRSADIARDFGRVIARMHNAAQAFVPPSWFALPRRDVDDFRRQLQSFRFDGVTVSTRSRRRCAELGAIITIVLDGLGRNEVNFGVIHNDLSCRNIIVAPEGISVIDFENACWGYYLTDIVRALDLGIEADEQDALLGGYAEERPIPTPLKANLHHFLAAGEFAQQWF